MHCAVPLIVCLLLTRKWFAYANGWHHLIISIIFLAIVREDWLIVEEAIGAGEPCVGSQLTSIR